MVCLCIRYKGTANYNHDKQKIPKPTPYSFGVCSHLNFGLSRLTIPTSTSEALKSAVSTDDRHMIASYKCTVATKVTCQNHANLFYRNSIHTKIRFIHRLRDPQLGTCSTCYSITATCSKVKGDDL